MPTPRPGWHSRRLDKPRSKPTPWWLSNWQQHPYKAGSLAVLTVGGALLLMFFCRIGEMPEINLANSTSILAAVAAVGLLVISFVGGGTLAPGLALCLSGDESPWLQTRPNLLLMAAPGMLLVVLLGVQALLGIEWLPAANGVLIALLMAWVIADARIEHLQNIGEIPASTSTGEKQSRIGHVIAMAYLGMFWTVCTGLAVLFLLALLPNPSIESWIVSAAVLAWSLFCFGMNMFVVLAREKANFRIVLGTIGVGLLVLLTLTQNYTGIAVAAVRVVGLGDIPVRLVVTANGCDLLNAATPGAEVCALTPGKNMGVVCPAMLRSKIGTPFLIEVAPFSVDGRWPTQELGTMIPIPRTEVLSWPRISPLKTPSGAATAPSRRGATYLNTGSLTDIQKVWISEECGIRGKVPDSGGVAASATSPAPSAASSPLPQPQRRP